MFTINKIKILSAVILAICSTAACFTACKKDEAQIIPDETVIGTQGEILGVSYYTVENETETHTVLFEITTAKNKSSEKAGNDKANASSVKTDSSENIASHEATVKHEKHNDSSGSGKSETESDITESSENINTETNKTTRSNSEKTTKRKHVPIPYEKKTESPTKKKPPVNTTVRASQQAAADTTKVSDETIPEKSDGINIVLKSGTVTKGDDASIMIQGEPGKKYTLKFYTTSSDEVFTELEEQVADENGVITWTFRVPVNCESGNRKIIVNKANSSEFVQTSITVK